VRVRAIVIGSVLLWGIVTGPVPAALEYMYRKDPSLVIRLFALIVIFFGTALLLYLEASQRWKRQSPSLYEHVGAICRCVVLSFVATCVFANVVFVWLAIC
jgi:hypothetical protein